ncbi:Plasmodesmata callose-binding protein 3 [Theobroma cacao]|uniref:Plasmodesmata callose-binding protein 3 n=1 Tax=Theobroma cacao TaxID=3641 RepID=A0A061FX01_THECC|nr:Plasmodesmata callose-binding protein 3 [Theobroma cacao]
MAALVLAVLILAMTGRSSATWCVCKDNVGDASLQKTLDYACGAGADCNAIHSNGPCFNPNSVKAHCNYAVNSYFQKKGQAQGSCDFAGTATVTASDPSSTGCAYPSSVSSQPVNGAPLVVRTINRAFGTVCQNAFVLHFHIPLGCNGHLAFHYWRGAKKSAASSTTPTTPVTTTTPSTTTPSTMNPSTNTPTSTTPYGTTTPTGVLGGVGTGLGPSGAGINTDYSDGGYRLQGLSFFTTLLFSGLMLLLG